MRIRTGLLLAITAGCGGASSSAPDAAIGTASPDAPSSGDATAIDAAPDYLRDVGADTTARVVSGLAGAQPDAPCTLLQATPDGRYVLFQSSASNLVEGDTNARTDIFLLDRSTGAVTAVDLDNAGELTVDGAWGASISDDGRYVAFTRDAATDDVCVRDRAAGTTSCVVGIEGAAPDGDTQEAMLSHDGDWLVFTSSATNLVPDDSNGQPDAFEMARP